MIKKTRLLTQFQDLYSDRTLFLMTVGILALGIVGIILVALTINPQDIAIAVRYSAFGDTHFYREKWQYTLNFVLFLVLIVVIHIALIIKLRRNDDLRGLAMGFGWLTVLLLLISIPVLYSVLGVAFLK